MTELQAAKEVTGGLSRPSKMPGLSYSLPAGRCPAGSKLRGVAGSVCSDCYAYKGNYRWPGVIAKLDERVHSIRHPDWVRAMVLLIGHYSTEVPYFRFHDSGDLQDGWHLASIVAIACRLPHIRFWLPTLEQELIQDFFFRRSGNQLILSREVPQNLNIRLSTPLIDGFYARGSLEMSQHPGFTLSRVVTSEAIGDDTAHCCPAIRLHTGNCGKCRRCWNRNVHTVVYLKH